MSKLFGRRFSLSFRQGVAVLLLITLKTFTIPLELILLSVIVAPVILKISSGSQLSGKGVH